MTTPKSQLLQAVRALKKRVGTLLQSGEEVLLLSKPLVAKQPEVLPESVPETVRSKSKLFQTVRKQNRSEPKNEFERFAYTVMDCEICELAKSRKQVVFGEGNPSASLVFVGEAPGTDEDREGRPFAGAAGELLTKIISSIGVNPEEVYSCNVLKCRPPGNRNPSEVEIENCRGYLDKQLALVKPKIICALGTFAAQILLDKKESLVQLRGKTYTVNNVKIVPTFHPAALLYHPQNKRLVWEDMKVIAKLLGVKARGAKPIPSNE